MEILYLPLKGVKTKFYDTVIPKSRILFIYLTTFHIAKDNEIEIQTIHCDLYFLNIVQVVVI